MQPPAGGPGLRGFRRGPQTPPGTAHTSWLPSTTTGISERTADSISPAPSGARQPQLRSCSQKSPTCTNTSQPSWAAVLSAAFMTSGCCGCRRAASRCPQPRQTPRRHRPRLAAKLEASEGLVVARRQRRPLHTHSLRTRCLGTRRHAAAGRRCARGRRLRYRVSVEDPQGFTTGQAADTRQRGSRGRSRARSTDERSAHPDPPDARP